MRRKKQARSNTQSKATQHSTSKAVTFPKKNELPQVGLEPTILSLMLTTCIMYIHVSLSCMCECECVCVCECVCECECVFE